MKLFASFLLLSVVQGNLEVPKNDYKHDKERELKKGSFLCGDASNKVFCVNVRQICDLSSEKPFCACAEGYTGSRCQDLIKEPESKPPTGMPTLSPIFSGTCTQQSGCSDLNSECSEGKCECKPGFAQRKGQCNDINECKDLKDTKCDNNAECINTEGGYECRCKDGYSDANFTIPGRQCQQTNECKLGTHNCDKNTEVCVDLRPPQKWKCVERTPQPSPKPTAKPTHPAYCTIEQISSCMNLVQVYGIEKLVPITMELPSGSPSWPNGYPKDVSTLIDDTGSEYYFPGSIPNVDIKFNLLQNRAINGVYIYMWYYTKINCIKIGLQSEEGVTTWIDIGSHTNGVNEVISTTFPAKAARYLLIRLIGGSLNNSPTANWGFRSIKVSGKCYNCAWNIGCWSDMCGCEC